MRPAMQFVDVASTFDADIQVSNGETTVDAKSIMQMTMLAATCGTVLTIRARGTDAQRATVALKELIEHAIKDGIKVIFVQPQFSTRSAKVIAREIGGQVAFADPLAEDWMANLRMMSDKFRAALK